MRALSNRPAPDQSDGKKTAEDAVFMEHLSSSEYFLWEDKGPARVLHDIDLLIKSAECWGISGERAFAIRLLLEIMANIRPYDGGRCILAERGMLPPKKGYPSPRFLYRKLRHAV